MNSYLRDRLTYAFGMGDYTRRFWGSFRAYRKAMVKRRKQEACSHERAMLHQRNHFIRWCPECDLHQQFIKPLFGEKGYWL